MDMKEAARTEGRCLGVAVPAAGGGTRMGGAKKPFLELRGEPLLVWALRPFLRVPGLEAVVVALGKGDAACPPAWLLRMDPRIRVVEGGVTRGDSVWAALEALPDTIEVVAVHDAARPLVTEEIIRRCLDVVGPGRGAVAGLPAVDTMKETDGAGKILGTPDRSRLWHAQTPQMFPRDLLLNAYRSAREEGRINTDDSALVEAVGGEVFMVPGSPRNLKVTRLQDLPLADLLLGLEES